MLQMYKLLYHFNVRVLVLFTTKSYTTRYYLIIRLIGFVTVHCLLSTKITSTEFVKHGALFYIQLNVSHKYFISVRVKSLF